MNRRSQFLACLVLAACCAPALVFAQADPGKTSATNTSASNLVLPKTEDDRRETVLRRFVETADEATVREIAKRFKIMEKGDLKDIRAALTKYLGLLAEVIDARRKSEVVVKDLFTAPDLAKNFVVYADEGVHVRSKTDPQSGLVTLHGDLGNLYVQFRKQTVSARLIRIDLKRREVFGEGNTTVREGDRVIIGDKFYFNADTKYGVVYNAETYIKPYFYRGSKIAKVGDKAYVLDDGWFTTCDAAVPHYRFDVGRAWLYQDVRLVAVDVSYRVSDFPVFWFPFIFHPMQGTGMWAGIGRDSRVGWFMQVQNFDTLIGVPWGMSFDFYQRLGIASTFEKTLSVKGLNIKLNGGVAWDKPLGLDAYGRWSNAVSGDNIFGNENGAYGDWRRELRWRLASALSWTIPHDPKDPKLGAASVSLNLDGASDPFFVGDFMTSRQSKIDLLRLYRMDEVAFFNQPGASGRNWSFALADRIGGTALSISGNWNFRVEQNPAAANTYANDAWGWKKESVVLPRLSYSFGGTLIASSPATNALTNAAATNLSATNRAGRPDPLDMGANENARRDAGDRFVNYSVGYNVGLAFETRRAYSPGTEALYEQRHTRTASVSVPASLSLGKFLSSSLALSLNDTEMWGQTLEQPLLDMYRNSSITSLNESFSLSLGDTWNKGLASEISARLTASHGMGWRVSALDSASNPYNAVYNNTLGLSAGLTVLRTTFSASTRYDMTVLRDELRTDAAQRFDNLTVGISSRPLDFLSISEGFTYVIRTGQASANALSLSLTAPQFRLPFIDKVTSCSLSLGWNHNYADLRASSLSVTISLAAKINDLWTASFALQSANRELYRYSAAAAARYGVEPRDLAGDFLRSLMVWNVDALRDTKFNLQALSARVTHDLHQWQLVIDVTAAQRVNTVNRRFSYFDFMFTFSITMKDNIGLTFPDQRYRYTADSEGRYYGKLN